MVRYKSESVPASKRTVFHRANTTGMRTVGADQYIQPAEGLCNVVNRAVLKVYRPRLIERMLANLPGPARNADHFVTPGKEFDADVRARHATGSEDANC